MDIKYKIPLKEKVFIIIGVIIAMGLIILTISYYNKTVPEGGNNYDSQTSTIDESYTYYDDLDEN